MKWFLIGIIIGGIAITIAITIQLIIEKHKSKNTKLWNHKKKTPN